MDHRGTLRALIVHDRHRVLVIDPDRKRRPLQREGHRHHHLPRHLVADPGHLCAAASRSQISAGMLRAPNSSSSWAWARGEARCLVLFSIPTTARATTTSSSPPTCAAPTSRHTPAAALSTTPSGSGQSGSGSSAESPAAPPCTPSSTVTSVERGAWVRSAGVHRTRRRREPACAYAALGWLELDAARTRIGAGTWRASNNWRSRPHAPG